MNALNDEMTALVEEPGAEAVDIPVLVEAVVDTTEPAGEWAALAAGWVQAGFGGLPAAGGSRWAWVYSGYTL